MQTFSLLHALPMSFFSKPFYRDVGRNWRWKSFIWLFLLLSLVWVPQLFKMNMMVQNARPDINEMIDEIPNITIEDGIVSADVEQPYLFTEPESETTFAILDTTGVYESLSDADDETMLLLTQDALHTRNGVQTQSLPLEGMNLELSPEIAREFSESIFRSWWLWALPFVIIGAFIFRLIAGLLFSLVGLIVRQGNLSYGGVLSLSLMTMTPAIVIRAVLGLIGLNIPFLNLILIALTIAYLVYALRLQGDQVEPAAPIDSPKPTV